MANTIQIKRSSTASAVPSAGQLEQGELAINIADEKLYSKNSSNVVFEIAPGGSIWSENGTFAEYLTAGAAGGIRLGIDANQNFEIEHDGGSAYLRLDDDATSTVVEMIFDIETATTADHGYRWRDQGAEVMELDLRFQRLSLFAAYDLYLYNGSNSNNVQLNHNSMTALTAIDFTLNNIRLVHEASTTARASLNIPEGVAPTTPADGDMWVTTTDAFIRVNGTSHSIIASGGITDVVQDTTPQLGGNLQSNGNDIHMAAADNIRFSDGTDTIDIYGDTGTGFVNAIGTGGWIGFDFSGFAMYVGSTLRIDERSTAPVNAAGKGFLWFRNDAPNTLWYTDDVADDYPVGFNAAPPVAISASQNMLKSQVGKMLHKNAGVAVTLTCAQDSTTWDGATWLVHNDDTEDLTIAAGASVTVYWLEAGSAPAAGSVTVKQGGIVTVYKYSNTEFWVWGAKDAAAGGVSWPLDPNDNEKILWGTGDDVEMYFNGTDFIVNELVAGSDVRFTGFSEFVIDDGCQLRVYDSTSADFVYILHNGTNGQILTGSGDGELQLGASATINLTIPASYLATGQTTGAEVRNHNGTFYDVGMNTLPTQNFNTNLDLGTAGAQACGKMWGKTTTSAFTLTGPSSSELDFPVGGVLSVMNLGTSGNLTFNDDATCTMYHVTGSAVTDIVGTGTLAPGGMVTLWRYSSAAIYIWGSGFTA